MNFRANPIVLRNHDPDLVVGTAIAIGLINGNEIGVRIKFAKDPKRPFLTMPA
jgi:hypothetical protein